MGSSSSIVVMMALMSAGLSLGSKPDETCNRVGQLCDYQIVQSMPEGLDLVDPAGAQTVPTHEALIDMVKSSTRSLQIASMYWWLTAPSDYDGHPSIEPGRNLMKAILDASGRGVKVEIVLDHSGRKDMNNQEDVNVLAKNADLKFLNMTKLLKAGIVHSKFMIADNKTFYVGSSNFDWRSYTQIKEIGVLFKDCPELTQDFNKIFRTYKLMADANKLPDSFGDDLKTNINMVNPLSLNDFTIFLGAAPPAFNSRLNGTYRTGRTDDIEGLLHVIERARHRIDISVMNYSPRFEFAWPHKYWPRIDDALRRAAIERRVSVRLLFSNWTDTKPTEAVWYKSLNALQSPSLGRGGIHVKLFQVPAFDDFQKSIPFARVKHDKFLVTDRDLYVGTSNWTPDYFTNTCGVGVVFQTQSEQTFSNGGRSKLCRNSPPEVVGMMQKIFERDFNSQYAHELNQH